MKVKFYMASAALGALLVPANALPKKKQICVMSTIPGDISARVFYERNCYEDYFFTVKTRRTDKFVCRKQLKQCQGQPLFSTFKANQEAILSRLWVKGTLTRFDEECDNGCHGETSWKIGTDECPSVTVNLEAKTLCEQIVPPSEVTLIDDVTAQMDALDTTMQALRGRVLGLEDKQDILEKNQVELDDELSSVAESLLGLNDRMSTEHKQIATEMATFFDGVESKAEERHGEIIDDLSTIMSDVAPLSEEHKAIQNAIDLISTNAESAKAEIIKLIGAQQLSSQQVTIINDTIKLVLKDTATKEDITAATDAIELLCDKTATSNDITKLHDSLKVLLEDVASKSDITDAYEKIAKLLVPVATTTETLEEVTKHQTSIEEKLEILLNLSCCLFPPGKRPEEMCASVSCSKDSKGS